MKHPAQIAPGPAPVDHTADAEEQVAAVQRHLLPSALPTPSGFGFASHYRPSRIAGGDFFGFQAFDDERLGFVIADVSGHGPGAAVMMAVLRAALAAFRVFGRTRESVAQDANAIINEVRVPGVFVTAFFVSLDLPTGNLYCGNCGHPTPIIRRIGGELDSFDPGGSLPIGVVEAIDPPMICAALEPGDTLVMYTDGITEARSASGEFFGEARLREAIRSTEGGADAVLRAIVRAVASHVGDEAQSDDECVLVCSRTPSAAKS